MKRNFITIIIFLLFHYMSLSQIYVDLDATGSNDGSSWVNAYNDLQIALDTALTSDTIWVAEGRYLPVAAPDETTNDSRKNAFHVANKNVAIYGSFEGTETSIDQRDIPNHPTILSGDFNNDDVITGSGSTLSITGNTENAYNVFILVRVEESFLDGFVIDGGNADGSVLNYLYGGVYVNINRGGGLHVVTSISCSTILNNTTVTGNSANEGGGINSSSYAIPSSPLSSSSVTLNNSTISKNLASTEGGGLYSYATPLTSNSAASYHAAVTVNQSTITGNYAADGGGIYCGVIPLSSSSSNTSTINIENSLISGNSASESGGGILSLALLSSSSSVSVTNSIITQNSALRLSGSVYSGEGGGISAVGPTTSITINDSEITNNTVPLVGGVGGGVHSRSRVASILFNNSTVSGNSAHVGGGASSQSDSASVIANYSTISGNSANHGGGISVWAVSNQVTPSAFISLNYTTVFGNSAGNGGGLRLYSSTSNSSDPAYSTLIANNSTIVGNAGSFGGAGAIHSASTFSSQIELTSSIVFTEAGDGPNMTIFPTSSTMSSNGYNIFSNSPSGAIASDQTNVSSASLNLQPLALNGGTTQTMLPGIGSNAVDAGNPGDLTDAQNRPIVGIRDIGAAEYNCVTNETDTKIGCGSYTWLNGVTYTTDNYSDVHTIFSNTPGVCDSIMTLDLTINNVDVSTTQTNGVTLTANATGAAFQWVEDCGNTNMPLVGETNQTFTASTNGDYGVIVTENGCSDTSDCITVISANVFENELNDLIMIYPNPATNMVTISYPPSLEDPHINLYDLSGKKILELNNEETELNNIDISKLTTGVFIVELIHSKGLSKKKLVIE